MSNTYRNRFLLGLLQFSLVGSILFCGIYLYRKYPEKRFTLSKEKERGSTNLRIVFKRLPQRPAEKVNAPVKIIPASDVAAAQREYLSERRSGVRLEEFVIRRVNEDRAVTAKFNDMGQAEVNLAPGKWWIYAVHAGPQELVWQLPVHVSGRSQTVELNPENVYSRSQSF